MNTPALEIQFDVNGDLAFPGQEQAIAAKLATGKIRNVVVLAHGWNNSIHEARELYTNFLAAAETVDPTAQQNAIAIEILWPARKFERADAANLQNYFIMRDRAGKIGTTGLNPLLARLQSQSHPKFRFHLAGHGFGARLLTAAADGAHKLRIASLLLLQPACSQNALATNFDGKGKDGCFHQILADRKIAGPILVTHSASLAGAHDQFGGMAAYGARHVEARNLTGHAPYDFQNGKVFNLNGDGVIGGRGGLAVPETAALLNAVLRQCVD